MNLPKTTLYPLSDDYLEKVDEICRKMDASGKPVKFKGSHLGREESGTVEEIRNWLVSAKRNRAEEDEKSSMGAVNSVEVIEFATEFYVRVNFVWEYVVDEYDPSTWPTE